MALKSQHGRTKIRYFKTACLVAAFFVLGICIALLGPAIPTLAFNLETDVENLSFVFTARGCGYLVGSLLCAVLFKRINGYFVISLGLLVTAAGNFSVPFMPHFVLLGVAVLVAGTSMGLLDTGGNVLCLNIWGSESEPWMQTLHFFFAFGATLAPMIAKPFIRESEILYNGTDAEGTTGIAYPEIEETTHPSPVEAVEKFPRVAWSFIIAATSCILVSIAFCFLSFSKKTKTESCQEDTTKLEGRAYRLKIMALLFIFYLLYVGTEVTFGLFIYSFAIECERHYSKYTGTLLNSLFWGSFAVGRFFAIFFSKCTTPKNMLVLDLIGTTISTVVMSFFPYYDDTSEWLFWAAVALYGWSMASLFPTGITWAEHYITVTENAATVFVVGAALGEMLLPFVMSFMIARNPMNLMYFCATSTGLCIVNFLVLVKVANTRGSRLNLVKGENKIEMDGERKYDPVPTSDTELHPEDRFAET